MNELDTEAFSTWPSGRPWWLDFGAIGLVHWVYQVDTREKEALTPFNRVVFVHPTKQRPMKLTRRKVARLRKVWNKRRRAIRLQVSQRKRAVWKQAFGRTYRQGQADSTLAQVNNSQ